MSDLGWLSQKAGHRAEWLAGARRQRSAANENDGMADVGLL
jgi:hypothetical protein